MSDQDSADSEDAQTLQELFIDVTGETEITDRQVEDPNKEVVSSSESGPEPSEKEIDVDPKGAGLEDAIGDPAPE